MKTFEIEKTVCVKENDIIRKAMDRTYVRDVTIPAGIGTEVRIGLLSDVHINYCNERDFAEADPVIMREIPTRNLQAWSQLKSQNHLRRCPPPCSQGTWRAV